MTGTQIAVVGVDGRFPGAPDPRTFWQNLLAGVETISQFSRVDLEAAGVDPDLVRRPDYVPAAGMIADVECFDADFFGYTPREASLVDPQQRVLLECCWGALEDAGHVPATFAGQVGVFGGVGPTTYLLNHLQPALGQRLEQEDEFLAFISNDKDFATTRVSYKLHLRGPSFAVQTACSTSLVAVHLACQSLMLGECDLALAGACSIRVPQVRGYLFQPGGIESADGHCRPFDASSGGTVFSSGAVVVALRRMEDALADGDNVYAVIRGTAINNDGSDKVGYTAPGFRGQASVIAEALALAEVSADSLWFVEAHGTGTALGDAVEVQALSRVFTRQSTKRSFCALGSAKANIGHLDTAAGGAGLIKAAFALKNGVLPPMSGTSAPAPELHLEDSPFYVATAAVSPPEASSPARAGVSSFGIGGTNAHVVLEQPPDPHSGPSRRAAQLLPISARSESARDAAIGRLATRLGADDAPELTDVAFTLAVGREHFAHRAFVTASSLESAASLLANRSEVVTGQASSPARVCFLFPGQGAQFVGMGRELYTCEPVFAETLEHAARVLEPLIGLDLIALLFPPGGDGSSEREMLRQTRITQPALAAVEYATAAWLESCGVRPDLAVGHSIGEYVAACLAGVFSFEDLLRITAVRGSLMSSVAPGRMIALRAGEDDLSRWLTQSVDLATVNAPDECVISGDMHAIESLSRDLSKADVVWTELETSHAFHSRMMEPILDAFRAELTKISLRPPRWDVVSNVTGEVLTADQATAPDYWAEHLRRTVRFARCLETALGGGDTNVVEVGPGVRLTSLARRHPSMRDGHLLLSTLPRRSATSASEHALRTLGQLWVRGAELEWSGLYAGQQRRRVSLPTYPFERARHWIDATQPLAPRAPQTVGTGPYVQTWKRIHSGPARAPAQSLTGVWVIRADRVETARRFGAAITDLGGTPALGGAVSESVEGVVYALEDHTDPVAGVCDLSRILRTIEDSPHGPPRYFVLLTTGVFDVSGEETLDLGHAPLAGYMRCIARELPETRCLLVDVGAARLDPRFPQRVLTDLLSTDGEPILAYRGNATWTAGFEPWPMLASNDETGLPCGAYLVVGGTGRLGLEAAQTICEMLEGKSAHLYLVARSPVPIDSDAFGRIDALRTASCQVEVRQVDATDAEGMRHLVDEIVEQHGSVAGVVYAAGSLDLTGFAPTSRITPDVCDVHFRPRVNGLAALRDALRDRSPGFCVVFSSVSSVLGGVSFGAYAAGNAFSDEMCLQLLRDEGLRWLSVGWDAWRFPDEPETSARLDTSGFEPTVGRALLRGILAAHQRDGWGGAVYCADDLAARHQRWAQLAWQCELHQDTPTRAMAEPEGDARGQLESIWHAVLGTRVVRDADDFFALGGSSLLALQLLAALRQRAAVDLSLAELLEHSTFGQLAALVSSHIGADMPEAPIPRVDPAHLHPLSRQQRGMWLAEQVNEHARGAFHVSEALSLEGPLDVGALVESFRALADRHEMLRARFVARDGIPFQTVDASSALDIRAQPLMSTDEPSFTHIVEHEFSRPFDLEQGCLVRVSILQDSPTRHILVFVAHHLVLDDWSIGTLLQELRELYAARLEGRDPDLPTLSVGYLDYDAWQASQSSQATRIDLDGYWSERLRGLPGVDPIPLDRPRPRTRTYRGGQVRTHVPVEQLQRVRAVAEERSTTPFMVLLALFRCVVDALAQADDLIVGTPTAGRDDSRLEHVVGYFVNAVPLRLGMPLEGTFSDLLVHIREIVFDAFAHQSEPSGAVLPIWFTLLTHTAEGQLAPGVTMSPLAIGSRPARFDLALILEPDGGGLRGTVEYSTDVFSETTGNLVAELFERACECVLQKPEGPLADVRRELRAIVAERRARDASALDAGARLSLASVRRRALTSS